MKTPLLLLPLVAILSAGCASKQPLVGVWRGDGFSPKPTDKIALTYRPNPSPEDAQLGRALAAELRRSGFNLVPQAEADYILSYSVEDEATETYVPQHDFVVKGAPQTDKQFAGTQSLPLGYVGASSWSPPPIGPAVVTYRSKGIRLILYTNPETHSGKFDLVWSGGIDAGETISAGREPLLIEALLAHFGEDYVGHVSLNK